MSDFTLPKTLFTFELIMIFKNTFPGVPKLEPFKTIPLGEGQKSFELMGICEGGFFTYQVGGNRPN